MVAHECLAGAAYFRSLTPFVHGSPIVRAQTALGLLATQKSIQVPRGQRAGLMFGECRMCMAVITVIVMLAQGETKFREPGYFAPVIVGMLVLGAVAWLIAAVLGFARARAFGPSARWFSFAAVCLILFHLQFLVLGFGVLTNDNSLIFGFMTFFNFFVVLAAVCAIMGFIRLTNPR